MKIICILFFIFLSFRSHAEDFIINSNASVSGSPQLSLILNDQYLITHVIARDWARGRFSKDVIAFQKFAKKLDPSVVKQFKEYKNMSLEVSTSPLFSKSYLTFFERIKKSPEYSKIKQQTIDYMKASIQEWDANLEKSTAFVSKYSGFNFNYKVRAYITHPAVGNGRAQNAHEKILSFGAWPTFKNYFTVYIWHELIHFHMGYDKTSHAVNQLLTDNDLRVFLNGDKLFPLQGHPYLRNEMKKSLGQWTKYKKSPTNLNDFVKSLN